MNETVPVRELYWPCARAVPKWQPRVMPSISSQVSGPPSPTTRLRRSRWFAPLIVLIVATAALGAGVAIGRYNESATSSSRFANTQAACDEWAASSSNNNPDNAWCSGMVS